MRASGSIGTLLLFVLNVTVHAAEIGFIEDFALTRDRSEAIKLLVPGSDDYYYYSCLHAQHSQQFDQVSQLLQAWIARYGNTPRTLEIQLRQSLLTYDRNPQEALDFLRRHLHLEFRHERESPGEKPDLPVELDQQLISRERMMRDALTSFSNLDGFEDAALDWLVSQPLDPDRRRNLIQRLRRPDYPNLPKLVVDDIQYKNNSVFGANPIHAELLLAQLEECLKYKPDLLNHQTFVQTYLTKLRPSADSDWQSNPRDMSAYLDRLWAFVDRLSPVHLSLRAHVLYHRLAHDRTQGIYDKERFLAYLRLPRKAPYVSRAFVEQEASRPYTVDLSADYRSFTRLPVVGNDESLVRDYLQHFFLEETTFAPYEPYVNDVYLRHLFAETKIAHGLGDWEQWSTQLPPDLYQQLKDRIDLEFAPTNRSHFGANEPVVLDLYVKNVRNLIVKVFEVNTRNFYRQNLREVNTDIQLDGLVANEEQTIDYPEPPLRRMRRHFEFPSLARPGVYVIDFIGNGMSSRAVVRKGDLRHQVRLTSAGHVFTILDDEHRPVKDAVLWLSGREFAPDQDGQLVVPFTDKPGSQTFVVSRGTQSCLGTFQHQAEDYQLVAGIYVDRESLLARRQAKVMVRPSLRVSGVPITVRDLEEVKLLVTSVDQDGVAATKEVVPFPLFEDRETIHEFQTPPRLSTLTFTLTAKIRNLSRNRRDDLSVSESFAVNSIDATDRIEDLHLAKIDGNYVFELLGKTGEPRSDRPLQVVLKHKDFRAAVNVLLKSDARGRVALGPLAGISTVTVNDRTWTLSGDRHSYHRSLHGVAGEPMEIAFEDKSPAAIRTGESQPPVRPERSNVSLLEVRGNTFVADRFAALSIENGMLVARDLPAGDYDLWLKNSNQRITLRLAEGERRDGYVLGAHRYLEQRGERALQIAGVTANQDELRIQLHNATRFARVHVFATRYLPAHHPFDQFARVSDTEPYRITLSQPEARYVSGRNIGDEYRYIIDRRFAAKFPGVMLVRPSLLLNPWAVRTTQAERQEPRSGTSFSPMDAKSPDADRAERGATAAAPPAARPVTANLDFLGESSALLSNLVPDDKGLLVVPRRELGAHQLLHVVAVDPVSTAYRSISLPEQSMKFLDLRLAKGLDPQRHFTQQKKTTVVAQGESFEIADLVTSRFEAYDSLPRVFAFYTTLTRNPQLAEFAFLMNWPELKPAEKQAKYSQYACHELHFFLYHKDPLFFNAVVRPYLANKRDRTFLDRWLLDQPLDAYLRPWNYERLNVVERILLSQRIASDRQNGVRHVRDLFQLLPTDLDRLNFLFDSALRGGALETEGRLLGERKSLEHLSRLGVEPATNGAVAGRAGEPAGGTAAGQEEKARATGGLGGINRADDSTVKDFQKAQLGDRERLNESLATAEPEFGLRSRDKEAEDAPHNYFFDAPMNRQLVRQMFQALDTTQEWAENNYYKLPIEQQDANLIVANAFWRDYSEHDVRSQFRSRYFAEASRNFTEVMFALALLDLPFKASPQKSQVELPALKLTAASPFIAVHEEIREATQPAEKTPILVSQNFFHAHDRYRHVNNEQLDKFVTDEFLVHRVYGCQVVVTNPTSTPQKLDVLTQIPVGAIAVSGREATRSAHIQLAPFGTHTIEYFFYFPTAGKFPHYPVHVAKNELLLASADPITLVVVDEPSRIDRDSWDYVSQHGTAEQVIEFLRNANLHRLNLDRIAFRMRDPQFFATVIELLATRHAYSHTLWSYAIYHNVAPAVREYLRHEADFVTRCGPFLQSPLLAIDPVERMTYQQLDYVPLVNARAHSLGRRRQILNDRLSAQYHNLLNVLGHKRELSDEDRMAVVYYLLLQDRVDEAGKFFTDVNSERLTTRLQFDYFAAYLDLCHSDLAAAETIAYRYANYPVDRWRNAFGALRAQVQEAKGSESETVDPDNRDQIQSRLASTEPAFDVQVAAKQVTLHYQNLERVVVNYYRMDVELLFSRSPFVQSHGGQFSHIRPNLIQTVDLPQGRSSVTFDLPLTLQQGNVLVEIVGGGQAKSQPYYANAMAIRLAESYGQVSVVSENPGKPLPKVYVKVYARMKDGNVRFFKDGYTDLRGRFDYASLNTNDLQQVDRFALLILSDDHGAMVREAGPPQQ